MFDLGAALEDGFKAGDAAAAAALGLAAGDKRTISVAGPTATMIGFAGAVPHDRDPRFAKAFVDWQNDVTSKDLKLATREGFRSIEHIKRYTTTGMATDQGKTSNLNALGIVSGILDKPIPEIGLTTFRLPYTPVTFGEFAVRRAATCSIRCAPRRSTAGRSSTGRPSKTSASGSALIISRPRRDDARRGRPRMQGGA